MTFLTSAFQKKGPRSHSRSPEVKIPKIGQIFNFYEKGKLYIRRSSREVTSGHLRSQIPKKVKFQSPSKVDKLYFKIKLLS